MADAPTLPEPTKTPWAVSGMKRSGLPEATIEAVSEKAAKDEYRRRFNLGPYVALAAKRAS